MAHIRGPSCLSSAPRYAAFFSQLPKDFSYAVEIRNGSVWQDTAGCAGLSALHQLWEVVPSNPLVSTTLRDIFANCRLYYNARGVRPSF